MIQLDTSWQEALAEELHKDYFVSLMEKVSNAYETDVVYPPKEDLFSAFSLTPFDKVRVVILGQDPYHEPDQAHGLAFSVRNGITIPPSLRNIYKELSDDLGCSIPNHGYLVSWAQQGVLLLNTVLTVGAHDAFSHKDYGWETFTDAVIKKIDEKESPVVFLLWGGPAGKKSKLLKNPKHCILKAPHPSPLSSYRGFFGCKHFSKCNAFLKKEGLEPIDWQIKNLE